MTGTDPFAGGEKLPEPKLERALPDWRPVVGETTLRALAGLGLHRSPGTLDRDGWAEAHADAVPAGSVALVRVRGGLRAGVTVVAKPRNTRRVPVALAAVGGGPIRVLMVSPGDLLVRHGAYAVDPRPAQHLLLHLYALGTPKTKGSLVNVARRGQKTRMAESTEGSEEFRYAVAHAVHSEIERDDLFPLDGPIRVDLQFVLPMAPGTNDLEPIGKGTGDLDKLTRNVYDALTSAGAIVDDSIITRNGLGGKRYASEGEKFGVDIRIWDAR